LLADSVLDGSTTSVVSNDCVVDISVLVKSSEVSVPRTVVKLIDVVELVEIEDVVLEDVVLVGVAIVEMKSLVGVASLVIPVDVSPNSNVGVGASVGVSPLSIVNTSSGSSVGVCSGASSVSSSGTASVSSEAGSVPSEAVSPGVSCETSPNTRNELVPLTTTSGPVVVAVCVVMNTPNAVEDGGGSMNVERGKSRTVDREVGVLLAGASTAALLLSVGRFLVVLTSSVVVAGLDSVVGTVGRVVDERKAVVGSSATVLNTVVVVKLLA
jgi:hypothetical protein